MIRRALLLSLATPFLPRPATAQDGPQPRTAQGAHHHRHRRKQHSFLVEMAVDPREQSIGLNAARACPPMAGCCSTGAARACRQMLDAQHHRQPT